MRILGVIPARYASTRFPGKPLALIHGKPMIQQVYENASKCSSITLLVVATDDSRIFDAVKSFGGEVMMTSKDHKNGTERCAEVLNKISSKPEIVINIQGDEPFIQASQIQDVIKCISIHPEAQIATLVKEITNPEDIRNQNVVKADLEQGNCIRNFSRLAFSEFHSTTHYKHIGIYAFKAEILEEVAGLEPSQDETTENLEQLRWLENGFKIYYKKTLFECKGIDTPKELENLC